MADKKKSDKAVALQYQDPKELPKIVAKGTGEAARTILRLAEEHDLPVEADSDLLDLLYQSPTGDAIAPETFDLVAEVLAFLYYVDLRWREKHSFLGPIIEPP